MNVASAHTSALAVTERPQERVCADLVDRPQRRRPSLFQNQPWKRSCEPEGGSPGLERAMSGSKSLSSMSAAASALRAIIMISELR